MSSIVQVLVCFETFRVFQQYGKKRYTPELPGEFVYNVTFVKLLTRLGLVLAFVESTLQDLNKS